MARKSQAERFLTKLAQLGGAAGNGMLSGALGMAPESYDRTKAQLLAEGLIRLRRRRRRARGG